MLVIGKAFLIKTIKPMYDQKKYQIETVDVKLQGSVLSNDEDINLPDGKVIAIGVVVDGAATNPILNVSIHNNGSEVTRPVRYQFLEKTTGGNFLDSFCPVDIDGGKKYQVRLSVKKSDAATLIDAQVLFIIDRNA